MGFIALEPVNPQSRLRTYRWFADSHKVTPNCPDPIIRATLTAVHRRDHEHRSDCCHPHDVEVVHLGHLAMTVCHDCTYEFGFDDTHNCEREADVHRSVTA